MKLIYKSFLLLAICGCFISQPLFAQTSGGPDMFGYTWTNSDDAAGPTFEWIDISESGTEITGLGDDNSAPLVDMGMTFEYYWLEFDQIKMGSNGWLSFSNVSNVAHCFPNIPQSGGGNNLIAPLMSDLNFDPANNNPAQLLYLNDGAGKFIVSYINVPFWIDATPAFTGSNTFQVIFDSNDNSITYNYLDVQSGLYNSNDACTNDAVIGLENSTGSIGLSVAVEMIPENETAIRFEFPEMTTFEVTDISAAWNINADNLGRFYMPEDEIQLVSGLTNTGNVEITSNISVLARIGSPNGTNYQNVAMTSAPIPAGETVELPLPALNPTGVDNLAGNYSFSTLAGLAGDLVMSNNENISEFSVVDDSQEFIGLSYVRGEVATTQASWSGGGGNSGMAVYMEPPFYPATISSVEIFALGDASGNLDDAFTIEIRDNDGLNGAPGTLIALESVDGGSYNTAGEWVVKDLSFPVTVTSGGFFVVWVMQGNTLAVGTETTGPFSRRVFEYVGGSFAQYRSNETADVMIKANLVNPNFVAVDDVELDNGVKVFPNPTNGTVNIDNQLVEDAISRVQVYNTLGQIILDRPMNIAAGDLQSIDLSNQPHGIYYLNIQADKAQITRKISLTK